MSQSDKHNLLEEPGFQIKPQLQTRCFIGFQVGLDAANAILKIQRQIHAALPADEVSITWIPLVQVHVTLKYLGEVEQISLEAVVSEVGQMTSKIDPFSIKVQHIYLAPEDAMPAYLWLGVNSRDNILSQLHQLLQVTLDPLGFQADEVSLEPHITMGIVTKCSSLENVKAVLNTVGEEEIASSQVNELIIFGYKQFPKTQEFRVFNHLPLQIHGREQSKKMFASEYRKFEIEHKGKQCHKHCQFDPCVSINLAPYLQLRSGEVLFSDRDKSKKSRKK